MFCWQDSVASLRTDAGRPLFKLILKPEGGERERDLLPLCNLQDKVPAWQFMQHVSLCF